MQLRQSARLAAQRCSLADPRRKTSQTSRRAAEEPARVSLLGVLWELVSAPDASTSRSLRLESRQDPRRRPGHRSGLGHALTHENARGGAYLDLSSYCEHGLIFRTGPCGGGRSRSGGALKPGCSSPRGARALSLYGEHTSQAVDRLLAGYKGYLVADAHAVDDHLYAGAKSSRSGARPTSGATPSRRSDRSRSSRDMRWGCSRSSSRASPVIDSSAFCDREPAKSVQGARLQATARIR